MLSIIIPSLNAETTLLRTVEALRSDAGQGMIREILLVDGGSSDGTLKLAQELGLKILKTGAGRGRQLAHGAAAARAPWLLFLHADTALEPGWGEALQQFLESVPERELRHADAAVFRFGLDDDSPSARRLERAVQLRCQILKLPYGDQGLVISRQLYIDIGGYKPMPLLEDVDIIRRIGGRNIRLLSPRAVTSARRFRERGYLRRSGRNLLCLSLYYIGVPIATVQKIYEA